MKKHKIKCKFILSYEDREDVILYCENVTDQFSGDVEDIDGQSGVETGEVSGKVFGPDELEDEEFMDFGQVPLSNENLQIITQFEWTSDVTDKEREEHQVFIWKLVTSRESVIREFEPITDEEGQFVMFSYTQKWDLVKTEGDYDPDQDPKDLDFQFISIEDVVVND